MAEMNSYDSDASGFKCSICLEFSSGSHRRDFFVSTPGGHIFHYSCIRKHIDAGNDVCPICREHVTRHNLTRLYGIDPTPRKASLRSECSFLEEYTKSEIRDQSPKPDFIFKLVLLGNSSVGKSSLLQRFTTGEFGNETATTGCDLCCREMTMGGKNIKLMIWDTVGQEKFRAVATNCVRNAHGVMLVYDVTDMTSFYDIDDWIQFVDNFGPPNVIKLLVGNKVDVEPEEKIVQQRLGMRFASDLGLSFFETSAKQSSNVEAAFRCLVGEIIENKILNQDSENFGSEDVSNNSRLQLPCTPSYGSSSSICENVSPYQGRSNPDQCIC